MHKHTLCIHTAMAGIFPIIPMFFPIPEKMKTFPAKDAVLFRKRLHLSGNIPSSSGRFFFIFSGKEPHLSSRARPVPSAEEHDTTKKYPLQAKRIPTGEDTLYSCRKNRTASNQ